MEDNKEKKLEDILVAAKVYLDNRIEYTRLSLVEKGAKIMADLITNTVVIFCFVLAFLFASITLALYLSEVLNSFTEGFGLVAAIYLLLSIIVWIAKGRYIEKLLVNMFIRTYFDKVANKDDDK
jgi:hypothetical protein